MTIETERVILDSLNAHEDLLAALETIASHLSKAEKFAAVEYSDDLLVPYSDIEKFARDAIAKARGQGKGGEE